MTKPFHRAEGEKTHGIQVPIPSHEGEPLRMRPFLLQLLQHLSCRPQVQPFTGQPVLTLLAKVG